MNRTLLLLAAGLITFSTLHAQTYPLFTASGNIDIGNINATHLVHGDMWHRPDSLIAACEYPKGTGKHVGYTSGIWMVGYDNANVLHVSGQTYRRTGTDYWPGPIDSGSSAVSYATSQKWAKIWKINRSTIDSFRAIGTHTLSNTPAAILEWPAVGNPYAKGNAGVALTISQQPMAPFVDVNNDGQYNPIAGDYPLIKGDQMLWWVINDVGPTHTVTSAAPFGIQIRVSAYAYSRGTAIDNMIFYEYLVGNKNTHSYHNFRFGGLCDFDLGYPFDDYIGFDSTHRMGFNYNGKSVDGTGYPNEYGVNPPAVGLAIMEIPGDIYGNYKPVGSFMYGYVQADTQFALLMNAHYFNGSPLANNSRYIFDEVSECQGNTLPGDRRFILATDDVTLAANSESKFATALVVIPAAGGCPFYDTAVVHRGGDTVYKYYWNPPPPLPTGIGRISAPHLLKLYPNPSSHVLYVDADRKWTTIGIYNALGQPCTPRVGRIGNKFEVITETLPSGVYTVRCTDSDGVGLGVFVKQ